MKLTDKLPEQDKEHSPFHLKTLLKFCQLPHDSLCSKRNRCRSFVLFTVVSRLPSFSIFSEPRKSKLGIWIPSLLYFPIYISPNKDTLNMTITSLLQSGTVLQSLPVSLILDNFKESKLLTLLGDLGHPNLGPSIFPHAQIWTVYS